MKTRLINWSMEQINIKVTCMDGRELYGKIKNFDELGLEVTATKVNKYDYESPKTILIPWSNVYDIVISN